MVNARFVCSFLDGTHKGELWANKFFSDKIFKLPVIPQLGMEIEVDDFLEDEYLRVVIEKMFTQKDHSFGTRVIKRIVIFESHLDVYLS